MRKYYYDDPPAIYHEPYRPTRYIEMATNAAKNIHLHKQATALLLYYADSANSFRPACKTIEANTNISAKKVSEIRQSLVNRGLILYRQKTFIILDWKRISTFAALSEPIPIPRKKESSIEKHARIKKLFCVTVDESTIRTRNTKKIKEKIEVGSLKALSPNQQYIYKKLLNMTEDDFEQWLSIDYKTGDCQRRNLTYISPAQDDILRKQIHQDITTMISDLPMSQQEFDFLIDQHEADCSKDYDPLPF